MAPVVSPMIASARLIKQALGKGVKVVFVGPCIAKIDEAADIRHDTDVDAVLTFEDIEQWFREEGIVPGQCEDASFLNASSKILRMYPVTSGILESLKARGDCNNYRMITVDGIQECIALFSSMAKGELDHCFVEVNACKGGCVNGPAKTKGEETRFRPLWMWKITPGRTPAIIPLWMKRSPWANGSLTVPAMRSCRTRIPSAVF